MDLVARRKAVEVLGLIQVPQHGGAVFAARGAEGAVGRDGHRVDVARVADVVGLDAAGGEFPDLEGGGRESQFVRWEWGLVFGWGRVKGGLGQRILNSVSLRCQKAEF